MSTITESTTDATDSAAPAQGRRELRLVVAGSVDDGKSTLVGRLLFDTKSILADQYEAIEDASRRRGSEQVDLALLTDGLRAEREQGITIDVAYRYFSTPKRSFVLADTPGHTQYTRNTVTGASTAQAALVLVDARNGVLVQTRRHLAVMALLRVPHVIVAVNKMDAVDWSQERFDEVARDVVEVADSLGLSNLQVLAVSALTGEGVVEPGPSWSHEPPLLHILEDLDVRTEELPLRLPVQLVIRPRTPEHPDYRGLAGRIASGAVAVGEDVLVTPGGLRSRVTGIDTPWGPVERASSGDSVTVLLADELDVGRGQVLSHVKGVPQEVREISGTVAWLAERQGVTGARVLAKVGTATVRAIVRDVGAHWDLDASAWVSHGRPIGLNDIARVEVQLAEPVAVDDYVRLRETGAFILIDPNTGATLAAGMAGPPGFGILPKDAEDDEWLSP